MKKTLKRTILVAATLLLVILAVIQTVLSSGVITRIVNKIASEYVDGDASIGKVKVSVFRNFPNVRLDISSVTITYPHERFASFDSTAIDAILLKAGRGSEVDTLVSFDRFSGTVNIMAMLRSRYRIPRAELTGLKAYAHYYDSTAANWDIIRIPESEDTTSSPMDIRFGDLRIDGRPSIVYTDQQDTIFAYASFQQLYGKGKMLRDDKHRRSSDRLGIKVDSLSVAGRLPADTLVAQVHRFELFEHKDHVDLEADAGLQLFTWAFGRLEIPLELELEVGFPPSASGTTDLMIEGMRASIAHIPIEASAYVTLAGDSTYVDGRARIEDCRVGELIDIYGTHIIPALKDFSTDASISLNAEVGGWFGAKDGKLPPMKASLQIPDSHFAYEGVFDGGNFDLSMSLVNDDRGIVNAEVEDFCFKIPGADMNFNGTVADVLGADPLIGIEATACTEFAELVKYLPESLGIDAGGDVDFELSGSARLSQLNFEKLAESDLQGHIFSEGLRFSSPGDSLFAYASSPDVRIATTRKDGGHGLGLTASIDSLRLTSGATTYIMGSAMKMNAHNSGSLMDKSGHIQPLEADLSIESLNMRGSDSLMIGVRNSQNAVRIARKDAQPVISIGSGNKMIYMRTGTDRIALQNAALTASAQKRSARAREEGARRLERIPRLRPDSIGRGVRLPGDSAHVRFEKTLPDYLSELEFRTHDINIQLGESIVNLLKEWRPSGKLSVNYGTIATPILPLRNSISDLNGQFTDNEIRLSSLKVRSGESEISASGDISGLRGVLMGRKSSPITMNMDMHSSILNANELLAAYSLGSEMALEDKMELDDAEYAASIAIDTLNTAEINSETYSLLVLPGNISAAIDLNVDSMRYSNIRMKNFSSRIQMQERCLQLTNTFADANFGKASIEGFYSTKTKKDISAGFNLEFLGITSEKVVEIFPKVDSLVPMLKSFKGALDCQMAATTQLDTNMNILIPTINGVVKLNGKGLELEDTGELRKLAQILMFKDTKVGHIDDMSINGIIANNQLEVFPFIMGVDRYTLALKGLQKFDQNFKYHISVIKSPLPFKFGVNLWGNFDDWKYSIGKAQYKSTKIPLFTPMVDTMQVNLAVSIKDIFKRGVDAAIREVNDGRRNLEAMKSEMGYVIDDDDDALSADEQDQLDTYLIGIELENETKKIEEELEAMLEKEIQQNIKTLTEALDNRKK